jgi:hypothetical protein
MVSVNTGYQFDPNDEEQKKGNFQVLGGMIGSAPKTVQTEGQAAPAEGGPVGAKPAENYKIAAGPSVAQQQFEANKGADANVFMGEKVGRLKEGISTAQKKSNDAYASFSANNKFNTTVDPNEIEGLANNDQNAIKEFQSLKSANTNKFDDGVNLSGYDAEVENLSNDVYGFTNPNSSRGGRALDAALLRNSGKVGDIRKDLTSSLVSAKQGVDNNRSSSDSLVKDFETQRQQELARASQAIESRMGSIDSAASAVGSKQAATDKEAREQFQQNEALRLRQALEQRLGSLGTDYSSQLSNYYANSAADNAETRAATGMDLLGQQATVEAQLKAMLAGGAAPTYSFQGGSGGGAFYDETQAKQYNNLAAALGAGGVRTASQQAAPLVTKSNVDEILAGAPKLALNRVVANAGKKDDVIDNTVNYLPNNKLADATTGRGYSRLIQKVDKAEQEVKKSNEAVDKIAPTTYQREAVAPKQSAWQKIKKGLGIG